MSCEALRMDDGTVMILCGRRWPPARRRACAFCGTPCAAICDGERCTRSICEAHRWSAAPEIDLCPRCEAGLMLAAATPVQMGMFG